MVGGKNKIVRTHFLVNFIFIVILLKNKVGSPENQKIKNKSGINHIKMSGGLACCKTYKHDLYFHLPEITIPVRFYHGNMYIEQT